MEFQQTNPIPVPAVGPASGVAATVQAVFDWEYALKRKNLMSLYEKGKALNWNAADLDWSTPVDVEKMISDRAALGMGGLINTVMAPPKPLTDEELVRMQTNMNAFMLSQFLHGEQGALVATARIVESVPYEEGKFYAASQVMDEARHVEVYHRYLTEKLGISYPVNTSLKTLLDEIMTDSRWDVTFLGMQIMVEGLALAAFGMQRMMMQDEPLIVDITSRIMQDESRHVAFGVLALEQIYTKEMGGSELKEREDFVIDATHLLRDRLLMDQVFERLGWDVQVWTEWAKETPFFKGFRQMTFSKIVPNLKRLGLLTPRVRAVYEKLDLLRYENDKSSIEEAEPTPPAELVQLLMGFLSGTNPHAPAPGTASV